MRPSNFSSPTCPPQRKARALRCGTTRCRGADRPRIRRRHRLLTSTLPNPGRQLSCSTIAPTGMCATMGSPQSACLRAARPGGWPAPPPHSTRRQPSTRSSSPDSSADLMRASLLTQPSDAALAQPFPVYNAFRLTEHCFPLVRNSRIAISFVGEPVRQSGRLAAGDAACSGLAHEARRVCERSFRRR